MLGGIALHLPMLAHGHAMDNRLAGMPMDGPMLIGMAAIAAGAAMASFGAIRAGGNGRPGPLAPTFEAPSETRLNRWHAALLAVLTIGLVIDVMKPATLGFVLPGLAREYGLSRSAAALLPLAALFGTVVGSFVWGWLADHYGRRASIIVSTVLFVSTSMCGAMPSFGWNLVMCFLMGSSAGGMLPVVYTLLAEVLPSRHRSWLLVLVGGTGLVGGYVAASVSAWIFEPMFGWRALWLQGLPTGILLLLLVRFIPESPRFLLADDRRDELMEVQRKFHLAIVPVEPSSPAQALRMDRLTVALVVAALSWSFVNFGLLLWLPTDLQERGFSAAVSSGLISKSALLGLPAVVVGAWAYSRWSSKWTLIGAILLTLTGLVSLLAPASLYASPLVAIACLGAIIVGTNITIAALLPYCAENYPARVRGRATGLVAGSSKLGGVAIQGLAIVGLLPTLGQAALALSVPTLLSAGLLAWAGRETRNRRLSALDFSEI